MPFLKRLGFYLMGLAVGLVFLAFFFKKKSEETGVEFCYFPNCRVLKHLRSQPQSYSEAINTMLENKSLDTLQITYFLKDGDIDFGKSNTKSKPCKVYFIDGALDNKEATLEVRDCSEGAVVENIVFAE